MYWRKLSTGDLVNYCSVILTNSDQDSKQGDQQLYFLLSDNVTEDRVVRGMLTDLKLVSSKVFFFSARRTLIQRARNHSSLITNLLEVFT